MKDHNPQALCSTGKIRLRKRHADSRCDTAKTRNALRSAKAFERIRYGTANNQIPECWARSGEYPHHRTVKTVLCFSLAIEKFY
jgi:hypothetical protein